MDEVMIPADAKERVFETARWVRVDGPGLPP